jgi:hypothetical protein
MIYKIIQNKETIAQEDDESKQSEESKRKYDTVSVSDAARSYSPPAPPPDFSDMRDEERISRLRDAESAYGDTPGEDGSKSADKPDSNAT